MTSPKPALDTKIAWEGLVVSVQPRILLTRSFDERQHGYLGYLLRVDGTIASDQREFTIGIGKGAQAKYGFRVGDVVSGVSQPTPNLKVEPAEFYKTSKLKLISRAGGVDLEAPPCQTEPPDLQTYRERGHRRLDVKTYDSKCRSCIWGCLMPVEMIIDHWKPHIRKYRTETFCYGPKSCKHYKAGPKRRVPGRKGMSWVEEDWVDEDQTSHRGPDE